MQVDGIQFCGVEGLRRPHRVTLVRRIATRCQHQVPDGTVEPARVEKGEIEMRRQALGQGALAGGGRAVDRDDHGAPSVWSFV